MSVCSMQVPDLELTDNTAEKTDVRPAQFKWSKRYACAAVLVCCGSAATAGLYWLSLSCSGTAAPGPGTSFDNNTSPFIVGGDGAKEGSWLFMASVQRNWLFAGGHFCGGSLINSEWVLTAAHCVEYVSPKRVRVALGNHILTGPPGVSRVVAEIVLHPEYNHKEMDNDVALLRLTSPVPFNDKIKPVCLPANGSVFSHGTPSWVLGWGAIQEGVPLPHPHVLQQVQVPVVDNEYCNRSYPGMITDNMICAGLPEGGKDSCQGDSGGPMVSREQPGEEWVQSGVVSWGYGCARPGQPGVYARVNRFEEWIRSIVKTGLCFVQFGGSNSSLPAAVGSVSEELADLGPRARYLADSEEE